MSCHAVVANTVANDTKLVAIVGNPNAGKTSLFNALTGSNQKVGNYPGVTVEKVSATLKIEAEAVECIDVPGLYSISPASEDERVAVEVILGKSKGLSKPDLLVCVLDASNLERNLFFYSQIAQLGLPVLVALTMVDRVERDGRRVDFARLTNLLGVPVIPVNGHKGKGIVALKEAIAKNLEAPKIPNIDLGGRDQLEGRIALLRERLARIGVDATAQDVRESLFEPSEEMQRYINDFPEIREIFEDAKSTAATQPSTTAEPDAALRYQWASMVQRATVPQPTEERQRPITDRIDYILTHRVFGLIVFLAVMYLVFQSIYTFAQPIMDLIDGGFKALGGFIGDHIAAPTIKSLIVDGLIGGVGSALVFLPQILILFFFIAFLEGTGYLARAAFLMDRLLGWCGLNGRAFIPLLSSFACAIPGIMAARVMPDAKSRLATILVAPLMSCSARLPVYLLLIGAFIEPRFGPVWAGFALFAMHLLGMLISIPIVWFFNRGVLKGKRLPFLLELPPYQWPRWRDVWLAMYFRGKVFVTTAGTTIVLMSILIWGLSFFPRSDEARHTYQVQYSQSHPNAVAENIDHYVEEQQLAHSYLGRFGKAIEPVFRPAGFDWRITTAILSAFPARETVVPSLGIIFSLGGGSTDKDPKALQSAMRSATWPDGRPLMTAWTAVGLMVFFALCCQCMSTLATVRRETNSWKWPVFMFSYMTALAYIAAVLIHMIGTHL